MNYSFGHLSVLSRPIVHWSCIYCFPPFEFVLAAVAAAAAVAAFWPRFENHDEIWFQSPAEDFMKNDNRGVSP